MKTLTSYSKNGYDFSLHKRVGNLAIFIGISRLGSPPNFELIEIQSHNGRQMKFTNKDTGKVTESFAEPAEYPPSDSQWGTKGWTFQTGDAAHARMNEMLSPLTPTL